MTTSTIWKTVIFWGVSAVALAQSIPQHVDVFTSGTDGYHTYRIPAIETAVDGSLIVFAEARKHNRADPGHDDNDIDLVFKRSTDGGKTWSKMIVLDDPGERWSSCNPTTVVDRTNGQMWLFYGRTKPGRSSVTARPGTDDSQAWARTSQDHGVNWSKPIDITAVARDVEQWGSSFFGPGGAIQNRNGRLIVPVARITGRTDGEGNPIAGVWAAYAIYSDNFGKTWQRGQLVPSPSTSENQLVELADGTILMNARQHSGSRRLVATSRDGGATWTTPQTSQEVCQIAAGIERFSLRSAGDERDCILWTGPRGPGRQILVVRASYDEGKTFTNERVLSREIAAYSDMTLLRDGSVGVIWERGRYAQITFTRFDQEFVEQD